MIPVPPMLQAPPILLVPLKLNQLTQLVLMMPPVLVIQQPKLIRQPELANHWDQSLNQNQILRIHMKKMMSMLLLSVFNVNSLSCCCSILSSVMLKMIFVQFIKMLFAILADKLLVSAGSEIVNSTVLPKMKKVAMPMAMTIPNVGTKMVTLIIRLSLKTTSTVMLVASRSAQKCISPIDQFAKM